MTVPSIDQLTTELITKINEAVHSLKHLNIVVVGKTGVGKSTLVNEVFREQLAATGVGRPVTDHIQSYSKDNFPLTIYDTPGFEIGQDIQHGVMEEILKLIHDGIQSKDINKAIHCIWYCVNTASQRIEPGEIEWLKTFAEKNRLSQVPIFVILTQSFSRQNARLLRNKILDENLAIPQVIPVLAVDYEIDDDYTARAYGLDTLIQAMANCLPKEVINTLHNVQKASLAEKSKRAQHYVAIAVGTSATVACTPLPFANIGLLLPIQVGMLSSITAVYGLDISTHVISAFLTSTLGATGTSLISDALIAQITSLLPGVGPIASGMISSGIAGLMTTALGETYIKLMEALYHGEISANNIDSPDTRRMLANEFKKNLTKKK